MRLNQRNFFALFAALFLFAPVARANGRFPAAQQVLVGPPTAPNVVALRTTFGFIISYDGGHSFNWVCESVLQYPGQTGYDPAFVIDPMGRIQIALTDGQMVISQGGCNFDRVPSLEGEYIADLDETLDGQTIVAVSSSGDTGAVNSVYRSDDGGQTYQALGAGVSGVLFETLEMARTNTQRIYLTGVANNPRRVLLYRSDDGGTTLVNMPFAPASGLDHAYVAGVDPTQPDTVYVRGILLVPADGGTDGATMAGNTALLKSTDAGNTWTEVARTQQSMDGFAISDDGQTLWMGGQDPVDGLQRSDDAGQTWTQLSNVHLLGLHEQNNVLYESANYLLDGFALAQSTDRGQTFRPMIDFPQVPGAFACGNDAASLEVNMCAPMWGTVQMTFEVPTTGMDAAVMDAPLDARGSEVTTTHGCGCSVAWGDRGGGVWLLLGVVAVVGRRRGRLVA